jgi:hypothetical protein
MTAPKSKSELRNRLNSFRIERLPASPEAFDISLTEEEVVQDLQERGNDLLLGRFSEKQVIEALQKNGVWEKFAEKGYPNPKLTIQSIDPFRQRLRIRDSEDSPESEDSLLCELRVFDARLKGVNPLDGSLYEMDALVIDWLLFQNPRETFPPNKKKLPGQKYPGLGILRLAMSVILDFAKQIGKEAVVNIPEYYHNAVLYYPKFHFFLPEIEGKFLALRKFFSNLSLAESSAAVASGSIRDQISRQIFQWKPHEQILGLSQNVEQYFSNPLYQQKVKEAENRSRFEFVKES